ncbi:FmdE family protein [Dehalococcoidia bacterium]|nr:FmdE family protein [Dehalococcoidia bacterium]
MQKSRIKEGKTGIYRRTELEEAVEFHGHLCPPIVFGVRASQLGLERLRAERPEDEEIVAVIENDSCMVDAVQSASGCTLGKGNLILKNYGKMAVVFINRANGEAIRLIVKKKVMEDLMNSDFGRARREGHLPHEEMMKMAKEVSQQMMELSDEELFDTKKVQTETPRFARIFRLAKCSVCDEYFGEAFGRVKDEEIVCIPCFEEAK